MLLHKSVVNDTRVRREAEALADLGAEVTILELTEDLSQSFERFARVSAAPPAWVRGFLGALVHRMVFAVLFVVRGVRLRPDVVHAHDAAMLLPGLAVARLAGARLVYDSHELATGVPYRERGWGLLVSVLERIGAPRSRGVITVSDGIADRIAERYRLRRRPTVLRNVCALPRGTGARDLRNRIGVSADTPLVLHQGALATDRGGDVLVRAVARLPGVHLCFLGDGDRASVEQAREEADRGGAADRVHFLPSVPPEELLDLTASADVGVSLLQDTCENHRLALPNKLFEYLAAGIPVVVSDLHEMRRLVIENAVGWVARPDDPLAVAQALRAALADCRSPELLSRVAVAAERFTWERERESLLGLYRSMEPAMS